VANFTILKAVKNLHLWSYDKKRVRDWNHVFFNKLAAQLSHRSFLPNDVIFKAHEFPQTMYLIEEGLAVSNYNYVEDVHVTIRCNSKGSLIGAEMLHDHACDYKEVAITFMEVYALPQKAWKTLKYKYPKKSYKLLNLTVLIAGRDAKQRDIILKNLHKKKWKTLRESKASLFEPFRIHKAEEKRGNIYSPDSTVTLYWDLLLLIIILEKALVIPVRMCVTTLEMVTLSNILLLFADDCIALVYLMDMFFRMNNIGYNKFNGRYCFDKKKLRERYIETGSFKKDLLTLPFGYPLSVWLFFIKDSELLKNMAMLHCMLSVPQMIQCRKCNMLFARMRKLIRRWKLNNSRYLSSNQTFAEVTIRISKLFLMVLVTGTWFACAFILIGTTGDNASNGYNWIKAQIHSGHLLETYNTGQVFLRALDWSISTLMVVAIGDVTPKRPANVGFNWATVIFGVTINSFVIGGIAQIMFTPAVDQELQQKAKESVIDYMAYLSTKRDNVSVTSIIHQYFQFIDDIRPFGREEELFQELPGRLSAEIKSHLLSNLITSVHLFKNLADSPVIKRMSEHLMEFTAAPLENIVIYGAYGSEMYFLERGIVHIITPDDLVISKLRRGTSFGANACILGMVRNATVQAAEFCLLYMLKKDVVWSAFREFSMQKELEALKCKVRDEKTTNEATRTQRVDKPRRMTIRRTNKHGPQINTWEPIDIVCKKYRIAWTLLCCCSIAVYTFISSYHICFRVSMDIMNSWDFFQICALYGCDVFFIFDLYYRSMRFPVSVSGKVITEKKTIFKIHLERCFKLDVVSLFPWETLGLPLLMLSPEVFWTIFFFSRLPKLAKLYCLKYYVRELTWFVELGKVGNLTCDSLLVLAVISGSILVIHILGCIWFLLHRAEKLHYKDASTWWDMDHIPHDETTWEFHIYLRAIYIAMQLMSSVGFGDLMPRTIVETVFHLVNVMLSALFIATLIGVLSALIRNKEKKGIIAERKHIAELKQFMTDRCSAAVGKQVILFFKNKYETKSDCKDKALNTLPLHILSNIMETCHEDLFKRVDILSMNGPERKFKLFIYSALRIKHLIPNQWIFKIYDDADIIYFIAKGEVQLTATGFEKTISRGKIFGQEQLNGVKIRCYSAQAKTYCDIMSLNIDFLRKLKRRFPDFASSPFYNKMKSSQVMQSDLLREIADGNEMRKSLFLEKEELIRKGEDFKRRRD